MRRLIVLIISVSLLLISSTNYIFGESQNQWKYSKEVYFENQEEVKAIYLDEDIYRLAKEDLGDLRLIDENNNFIPYYIYNSFLSGNKAEYAEYEGKEALSFIKDNDYYIDFKISSVKENTDVLGNMLKLDVLKDSFYKDLQVFGSYDNKSWESIRQDTIYRVNGIEKLTISLENSYKYHYYRIVSKNDASGVAINSMSLVYDVKEAIIDEYKGFKNVEHRVQVNKESNETIININNKDKLRIDSIRLVTEGDFKRSYILYITNEQGERLREAGRGELYSFNLGKYKAENTSLQIGGISESYISSEYLQVVIKDRDDYPISIKGVGISYYIDKMVFKSKNAKKLYIMFGNQEATKPYYDINAYIEEIEKVKQENTTLAGLIESEIDEKEQAKTFELKWILNISVLLISGLLIILIIRKSK